MFLEKRKSEIEEKFDNRILDLELYREEIIGRLNGYDNDTALMIKYLYVTMPQSDIANYSVEVFEDYAKHGAFLWKNNLYSEELEEDMFLNYVLYHRVNEEEITPCRHFFYEKIKEIINPNSLEETIINLNYWCAQEVTYQTTDNRTASPMAIYQSIYARCGEESTFTVSVLRSAGIPARQVYAPRWSHCDDNHAWVEVWCGGKWYFLGACEPEEILNKGWFTNASSRAMLIHSRYFDIKASTETITEKVGMVTLLNQLSRYAVTKEIVVNVIDKLGVAISGAKVDFEVLNYSEFYPVASILTDENGKASLLTGFGDLHIHVSKEGVYEEIVLGKSEKECTIIFKEKVKTFSGVYQEEFDIIAPVDYPINVERPTKEQEIVGNIKFKEAVEKRLKKLEQFYSDEKIKEVVEITGGSEELVEVLKMSCGNFAELSKFLLEKNIDIALKEALLKTLSKKDYRDCKSKVLLTHLKEVVPNSNHLEQGDYYTYVLSPRIQFESITDYRKGIKEHFSELDKQTFCKDPTLIWSYITKEIKENEIEEYKQLITNPLGCLKMKQGNLISKQILFVAICRTLGIPARLNPESGAIEYYANHQFVTVLQKIQPTSKLVLSKESSHVWTYFQNWTISKLEAGVFKTLNFEEKVWKNETLTLLLSEGDYRIITANRLPNGNIFSYKYHFSLIREEIKKVKMSLREANLADILKEIQVLDFELTDINKMSITASNIMKFNQKTLMVFLEESKEPTEHILNELYDRKMEFQEFNVVFIMQNHGALKDKTIKKTIEAFPKSSCYYNDFSTLIEVLARRMYVDPDKLPLIVVFKKELTGIYATSGYNVGTADMLLKILKDE